MNTILRSLIWLPGVFWAGAAGAADAPVVIEVAQVAEIRAALGEIATVRGVVERTGKSKGSGMNFLNFKGGEFSAVVFAKSLKNFPAGEPADTLAGKLVEVRGTVALYDEKLQIVIDRAEQIVVLDPATKKPVPEPVEEGPEPLPEAPAPEAAKVEPEVVEGEPGKVDPRLYFDDP